MRAVERPNLLVTATAIVYFAVSVVAAGARGTPLELVLLQLLGAAIFGFAMLNWMHRYSRIGGILGRPLVMANLSHSMVAALMMLHLSRRTGWPPGLLILAAGHGAIAVGFGAKLFGRPPS
jgi:hypothetical protein